MSEQNFADRLSEAILAKHSPVCVGLDPVWDRLPAEFRDAGGASDDPLERGADAIEGFCKRVCELVAPHAATVKLQLAYFEIFGPPGIRAARNVSRHASELGLLVIGDVKRGDIGSTADAFAQSYFGDTSLDSSSNPARALPFDAVTVNPYMGIDAIRPFMPYCRDHGKGLFVLVKTSNPSSIDVQSLVTDEELVFHRVARLVAEWGAECVGSHGRSAIGAVVGATFPRELLEARERMPASPFLIPGVGAQGAKAEDVVAALGEPATNGVVNSSRGILYAYEKDDDPNDWESSVVRETTKLANALWREE